MIAPATDAVIRASARADAAVALTHGERLREKLLGLGALAPAEAATLDRALTAIHEIAARHTSDPG